MDTPLFISNLATLARVDSSHNLSEWMRHSFDAAFRPSSMALFWGRANPAVSLRPVFATDSYPGTLLGKARLKTESESLVPLLAEWREDEAPVVRGLADLPPYSENAWLATFKERAFGRLWAAGCYDIRANYMTYLCMTDPAETPSDQQTRDLLSVTLPLVHDALGRIWRRSHRSKQKQLHALLTKRETEVLSLVKKGKTNPEISTILGVTFPTVKNHVQNIMIKMRVSNRAQAVGKAFGNDPVDTQFMDEAWPPTDRGAPRRMG